MSVSCNSCVMHVVEVVGAKMVSLTFIMDTAVSITQVLPENFLLCIHIVESISILRYVKLVGTSDGSFI